MRYSNLIGLSSILLMIQITGVNGWFTWLKKWEELPQWANSVASNVADLNDNSTRN